ncbi:hypothetical protein Poly51_06360 [Rubripirellula tenax]|uniref:Uncharacterized protein n=1 Tax=Rubripirellula tenax TaxID=2528015 RepID=A0A5C6FFR8_9BACT|nr:hypothetical protein [Rubripirellula tenax]TWU60361.1 hypothetical protein Poly51_06360 [Rubripirellula tenax]
MDTTVVAPCPWVESITLLRLPEQADQRLQDLMDRNNEGQLTQKKEKKNKENKEKGQAIFNKLSSCPLCSRIAKYLARAPKSVAIEPALPGRPNTGANGAARSLQCFLSAR